MTSPSNGLSPEDELRSLRRQIREFFQAARDEGLWIGAGRDGSKPLTDASQYGPLSKALLKAAQEDCE